MADKDLVSTVDNYWRWFERRGQVLSNARRPKGDIGADSNWDLEVLQWWFRLLVPTFIKNDSDSLPEKPEGYLGYGKWSVGENLPFKSEHVLPLTEGGVAVLADAFGLRGADPYSVWGTEFGLLNRRYAQRKPEASRILSKMRSELKVDELVAAALLCLSLSQRIAEALPDTIDEARKFRKLAKNVNEYETEVLSCFQQLREHMSEEPSTVPRWKGMVREDFGGRLKRLRTGVTLESLLRRSLDMPFRERAQERFEGIEPVELSAADFLDLMEEAFRCAVADQPWRGLEKLEVSEAPMNLSSRSRSPIVKTAFNKLGAYIGDFHGKRGAMETTEELFKLWGVPMSAGTARRARNR